MEFKLDDYQGDIGKSLFEDLIHRSNEHHLGSSDKGLGPGEKISRIQMRQAHLPRWCRRSLDIDSTEQYFLNFSFSCQTEVPAHPRLRLSGTISYYLHTNLRSRSGVQDLGGLSVSTECSSVSIPYTPSEKFGFGFGVLFPPYLTSHSRIAERRSYRSGIRDSSGLVFAAHLRTYIGAHHLSTTISQTDWTFLLKSYLLILSLPHSSLFFSHPSSLLSIS